MAVVIVLPTPPLPFATAMVRHPAHCCETTRSFARRSSSAGAGPNPRRARKARHPRVVGSSAVVVSMNDDVGETIGWPEFADTVSAVHRELPNADRAVVLTSNYGEAGAIERYGPDRGLPRAYSGHNAFGDWGPPPDGAAPVITVGLLPSEMEAHLENCEVRARIDNREGVDNDEQGAPIWICRERRASWSELWDGFQDP